MRPRSLVPLALLGLLHVYIGARLLPDLSTGFAVRAGGALLLLVSYALMLGGLMARSMQPKSVADRVAAVGLFAVSLFSSLFVFTLLRDLVLLVAIVALSAQHVHLLASLSALLVVGIAVFITAVGFAGARRRARIVNVDVPLANLPLALHGFSIAQISDVHVGSSIKRQYVEAIVDAVNGLGADLIAVTGDLVDGSVHELARHIAPLARLRARHGAFVVTGNHEYYSGEPAWTAEFRGSVCRSCSMSTLSSVTEALRSW